MPHNVRWPGARYLWTLWGGNLFSISAIAVPVRRSFSAALTSTHMSAMAAARHRTCRGLAQSLECDPAFVATGEKLDASWTSWE